MASYLFRFHQIYDSFDKFLHHVDASNKADDPKGLPFIKDEQSSQFVECIFLTVVKTDEQWVWGDTYFMIKANDQFEELKTRRKRKEIYGLIKWFEPFQIKASGDQFLTFKQSMEAGKLKRIINNEDLVSKSTSREVFLA